MILSCLLNCFLCYGEGGRAKNGIYRLDFDVEFIGIYRLAKNLLAFEELYISVPRVGL